jgi:hypothetical protein
MLMQARSRNAAVGAENGTQSPNSIKAVDQFNSIQLRPMFGEKTRNEGTAVRYRKNESCREARGCGK